MKYPIRNLKLSKTPNGDVTQWFAENPDLYQRFGILYHNGIDISRPHGEPMFAIEDGTIAYVKSDPGGFGKHIKLISKNADKNGEHREWTYAHCSNIHVNQNDKVSEGEHIADMGNTGFVVSGSTPFWKFNPYAGTHLHLGLRKVIWDKTGWRFRGSSLPKMSIKNYENGVRGAIDPMIVLKRLDQDNSKPSVDNLKKQISLLTQVIGLMNRLISRKG